MRRRWGRAWEELGERRQLGPGLQPLLPWQVHCATSWRGAFEKHARASRLIQTAVLRFHLCRCAPRRSWPKPSATLAARAPTSCASSSAWFTSEAAAMLVGVNAFGTCSACLADKLSASELSQ